MKLDLVQVRRAHAPEVMKRVLELADGIGELVGKQRFRW